MAFQEIFTLLNHVTTPSSFTEYHTMCALCCTVINQCWKRLWLYVRVSVYVSVCTCVCMYVCLYVSLYVRVFVCTCISMYVCLYVCLYVRLFVCTCSNSPVRSPCTVNMVYFTVASAALYSWQAFSDTSVDVTWSCDISLNSEEWSITELYTKCNTRLILSTLLYNK